MRVFHLVEPSHLNLVNRTRIWPNVRDEKLLTMLGSEEIREIQTQTRALQTGPKGEAQSLTHDCSETRKIREKADIE